MNTAEQIVAAIPQDQLELAIAAMERKALFLKIEGAVYAAVPYDRLGWWVYRLEMSAPEYFVAADYSRCSCDAFRLSRKCKHIDALRFGSEWSLSDYERRQRERLERKQRKKRRKRGRRERGEN